MDVLSRINEREIVALEKQLEEVIHGQSMQVTELRVKYTSLQSEIDKFRRENHDLKLQLVREEDEKEALQV